MSSKAVDVPLVDSKHYKKAVNFERSILGKKMKLDTELRFENVEVIL